MPISGVGLIWPIATFTDTGCFPSKLTAGCRTVATPVAKRALLTLQGGRARQSCVDGREAEVSAVRVQVEVMPIGLKRSRPYLYSMVSTQAFTIRRVKQATGRFHISVPHLHVKLITFLESNE